jgi:hypothetical protein
MWKLFFEKLWQYGVFLMLAWIQLGAPSPTLRETMYLMILLCGVMGLLGWVMLAAISPEEALQPKSIRWTAYPFVFGVGYYALPRLGHFLRSL